MHAGLQDAVFFQQIGHAMALQGGLTRATGVHPELWHTAGPFPGIALPPPIPDELRSGLACAPITCDGLTGGVPCAVRALCEKLAVLHHREFGKFRRLEGRH